MITLSPNLRRHLTIAATYAGSHALFALVTERSGLFMTSSSSLADLGVGLLGLFVMTLRLYALFVFPTVLVYELLGANIITHKRSASDANP